MSAPKLTIREWLWSQHCTPEVMADFEKLFALPNEWRGGDESTRQWKSMLICADELEAILRPEKSS